MRVYVVRKWPLPGEKSLCVLEYHTVSLWLLCNVHFLQSIRLTIAMWPRWPKGKDHCRSEEYIDAPMLTRVCVARTWISYRCVPCHRWCIHCHNIVSMCAVSPVVHTLSQYRIDVCRVTSGAYIATKKSFFFQFSCGCEHFHWGRSFGFLVINACNNREHYETPCMLPRTG